MRLRAFAKKLVVLARNPAQVALRLRHWWVRRTPVKDSVIDVFWGASTGAHSRKLCLFSTFDPQGKIDPYVKRYLRHLHSCGFDLVVVSTSAGIEEQDLNDLKQYCRAVILRKNVGLDFASWKAGMEVVADWAAYDALLLANDSVYGPFCDLRGLFEEMDAAPEAVHGLTESLEMMRHLQSYFLYFKRDALRSRAFQSFFERVRLEPVKYSIIVEFEMGISQAMHREGFALRPMYPYRSVEAKALELGAGFQYADKMRSESVNPSVFMWDLLLKDFGFPFIKTEILKINWLQLANVSEWKTCVPESGQEWIPLIERHLERIRPSIAQVGSKKGM